MITTKTIHEIHNARLDTLIDEVEEELSLLEPTRKFYKEYFNNNRDKYKARIDYELLYKGLHEQIEFPFDNSDKYFNIQIKNYNVHNVLYSTKLEEITKLKKQKINEGVFVFILKRFNKLLIDAIVKEGYCFYSLFIGGLKVKVVKRTKPEINWGESIKAKEKLLEQGLIPFTKEDEKKAIENNEQYNGVQWLVHLPVIATYFEWCLETAQFFRISNIKNFKFDPVRGIDSPVTLLRRYEETLSEDELFTKYKYIKNVN